MAGPAAHAASDRAAHAAAEVAGIVHQADRGATITSPGGTPRAARAGEPVRVGDTLRTGSAGELHVTLLDTGFIALRADSRVRVEDYKADGGADDRSVLRLLRGGFRSITGWIGKFNAQAYKVLTPTATIGIRGTDHEPRYIEEGSAEGEAGTYDRVYAGATLLESAGERAEVAPEQAGFAPLHGRGRPRVLAKVPAFFRPGPHEAELARKHQEIQRLIDQRRDERRRAIEEKRAEFEAARQRLREQRAAEPGTRPRLTPEERAQLRQARQERESVGARLGQINRRLGEIRRDREAIEADVTPEGRRANYDRLRQLNQEARALVEERSRLEARQKVLEAEQQARERELAGRAAGESEEMKARREEMQRARRELRDERDATREEIHRLRQEERERYKEEVRTDRKSGDTAPPPADPPRKE